MPDPSALELAKELSARKSVTPEDGGCQELLSARLTKAGFRCEPMKFGDVELRREQGVVLKAGKEVSLTKTEFRLLCEFADHVGSVLSRDQLLERVWGYEYLGDSRLVDAHVRRLRVKVEDQADDPKIILTARGLGYRLVS